MLIVLATQVRSLLGPLSAKLKEDAKFFNFHRLLDLAQLQAIFSHINLAETALYP